jgi:carbon-monoxide dehydrogenase medium subunit/xanthine dehydrogenase FAD-binding subunit
MLTCDHYLSPRTLDEAFDAMAAHAGRYRLVAGATDLLPWAREGRAGDVHVETMIDVAGIPELRECAVMRGGRVRLGAATPFQRFLDDRMLSENLPCMSRCAIWFADDQIRESATLGGNLVNASPAADGTPPMLALNAVVELAARRDGAVRRRSLPLAVFIQGPGRTLLDEDEILVAVECDALSGYGGAYEKVGHRRSLVISVACVAAAVRVDRTGRYFEDVRLAVGGVGPKALRLADVEALLRGAPIDAPTIREAAAFPVGLVQSRTRQAYRRAVFEGFVARALVQAARDAGADTHDLSAELEPSYA